MLSKCLKMWNKHLDSIEHVYKNDDHLLIFCRHIQNCSAKTKTNIQKQMKKWKNKGGERDNRVRGPGKRRVKPRWRLSYRSNVLLG